MFMMDKVALGHTTFPRVLRFSMPNIPTLLQRPLGVQCQILGLWTLRLVNIFYICLFS